MPIAGKVYWNGQECGEMECLVLCETNAVWKREKSHRDLAGAKIAFEKIN